MKQLGLLCAISFLLTLGTGCASLLPAPPQPPSYYSLNGLQAGSNATSAITANTLPNAPTIIISPTHTAAAYNSQHIIYLQQPYKLAYFAHSEWVDTPARMLSPLIVSNLEQSGLFHAVISTQSAATGQLKLDTEIIQLQQEFTSKPSRVKFTLRAYLLDTKTRNVIASQEFDETVAASSDDPIGGVIAANMAVQAVLVKLRIFCVDATKNWQAQ